MRHYLFISIFVVFVTSSCDNHQSASPKPSGSEDTVSLTLNGDTKWKMDEHTRAAFESMSAKASHKNGDLKALGSALQADLDKLIQGCTMTGDAHNELHKFLTAYMPAVQKLTNNGGDENLETIKQLLDKYPDYFE